MQLPVQCILPNPDGRGQEHLMPVCVVRIVQKEPSGVPPFATMAILAASHATAHPWLHSLPPRVPGKAFRATCWWMRWSAGTEWPPAAASTLPRPLSCRVRKLVAHRALPGRVARHGSSLRCLGWPSRQAPLAGALSPWLEYFVLEWLQKEPWRTLAVARQALPRGCCNCPCTSSGY